MADGKIIIDTEIDNSGAEKGVKSLSGKLSSIASTGLKVFTGAIIGAGTALTGLGIAGIKLASDLNEVQNVVDTTFGKNASKINDWAKNAASAFGLSELNAKQYTGTLGAMLKSMGLTSDQTLKMSESMVGLSGDFASFYNLDPAEAFEKIRSGISGETEPLKQLGINMSVANLSAYALAKGIKKPYNEMTQGEQALLRYNYLMSVSKDAQGDFAKTSDSLANQMRIAKLNMQELGSEVGTALLPIAQEAAKSFNELANKLREAFKSEEMKANIQIIAQGIGSLVEGLAKLLSEWLPKLINGFSWIVEHASGVASGIAGIGAALLTLNVVSVVTGLIQAFQKAKVATEGLTVAQWLYNTALAAVGGWIGLVIIIIVGLVAAIITLWNTNEGFRNAIIGAWNSILNAGKAVWGWLVNFFTVTIPAAWQSVIDFFTGIPGWFVNLWTIITQAFVNGWNAVVNFFTVTIPAWIQSVFNWFNELPYMIGYALGYVLATIVKWGIDTWNYLVTNVPIWIGNVVTFFSELPGKIWTWLVNTIINIATWGVQMYNNMVSAVSNAINAVINWFIALPGRVWTWLVNTVTKVAQFASNLGAKARQAGSNMFNAIVSAVTNLPSTMANIGINIVKGVWNGITGMGSWLGSKVKGFFSGIVDGAKAALGIKSPSKVFRDQVGKYMAQGVGVGFEDETENIKSSMKKNLSDLTAKMQATVEYETVNTSAGVIAKNNNITGESADNKDTVSGAKAPIIVHAHLDVDGKEFTQTVVAPHQDELDAYYDGRGTK